MIKILNVKDPEAGKRLRDPDREKFESIEDSRVIFLQKMVNMFKLMGNQDSQYPGRVMRLTEQTSKALDVSITGVQSFINILLEKGMSYCLTVESQSDNLEGEFGTWRQMNGGNYYMSFDKVMHEAPNVEIVCKTYGKCQGLACR